LGGRRRGFGAFLRILQDFSWVSGFNVEVDCERGGEVGFLLNEVGKGKCSQ
jgi:hypothetical protein